MNYNNKKFDFEIYQSIKDLSVYSGGPTKTVKELSSNLINAGLNLKLITQNGYIKFSNLKNKNLNYESYLKSRVSLIL